MCDTVTRSNPPSEAFGHRTGLAAAPGSVRGTGGLAEPRWELFPVVPWENWRKMRKQRGQGTALLHGEAYLGHQLESARELCACLDLRADRKCESKSHERIYPSRPPRLTNAASRLIGDWSAIENHINDAYVILFCISKKNSRMMLISAHIFPR